VEAIRNRAKLDTYYLLYAVLGEFDVQLNRGKNAAAYFRQALELADTKSERQFLAKKLKLACSLQERSAGRRSSRLVRNE
jgi:predicted RNA polymerase sigma factor